jgi:hypothetical protein
MKPVAHFHLTSSLRIYGARTPLIKHMDNFSVTSPNIFNIIKLCTLPTTRICVLRMVLTVSLDSNNRLVSVAEKWYVSCEVRNGVVCYVWFSKQTAIISLIIINWLVSAEET